MKFKITESCLHNGGEHAEAGDIVEVSRAEAQALSMAGRGYVLAAALPGAEPVAPAQPEPESQPEPHPEPPARPAKAKS